MSPLLPANPNRGEARRPRRDDVLSDRSAHGPSGGHSGSSSLDRTRLPLLSPGSSPFPIRRAPKGLRPSRPLRKARLDQAPCPGYSPDLTTKPDPNTTVAGWGPKVTALYDGAARLYRKAGREEPVPSKTLNAVQAYCPKARPVLPGAPSMARKCSCGGSCSISRGELCRG